MASGSSYALCRILFDATCDHCCQWLLSAAIVVAFGSEAPVLSFESFVTSVAQP